MSSSSSSPVVRWGILGTGKVANDFVLTLAELRRRRHRECPITVASASTSASALVEITRVAARSVEKAKAFAAIHGIRASSSSSSSSSSSPPSSPSSSSSSDTYREVYEAKDVDVVYVATIHPAHYDQVKACLMHGKHVLCEKPMTMSKKRTKELLDLARMKGLMLQEGMWTRFFPCVRKARDMMRQEEIIGEVMMMQSTFGCYIPEWEDPESTHRVLDKRLGGGSLLDIGVYPIGHALMAFYTQRGDRGPAATKEIGGGVAAGGGGDEAQRAKAIGRRGDNSSGQDNNVVVVVRKLKEQEDKEDDGDDDQTIHMTAAGTRRGDTDISASVNLVFRKRHVASIQCTISADLPNETVFSGTRGQIVLHAPSHAPTRMTVRTRTGRDRFEEKTYEFPLPKIEANANGAKFNYPNSEGFFYEAEAMTDAVAQRLRAGTIRRASTPSTAMPEYTSEETLASAGVTDFSRKALGVFWSP
eukprot:g2202.t1